MTTVDFGDMKNTVELVGFYGSDTSHALSAWTSTMREMNEEKRGRMDKLLISLAENKHHTPFEKSSLHFLFKTDIATHIQILKHRIGVSVNGESARYKELKEDKLYMPSEWPEDEKQKYIEHMEKTYENYHRALERLTTHYMEVEKLPKREARNRAKESARFYLPYGNQITCDVLFNFRSFMHFVGLRYSTHAQREICNLTKESILLVKNTGEFDISLRAFGLFDEKGNMLPPAS